jgi:flagellar hook-basal body complex protein FliE
MDKLISTGLVNNAYGSSSKLTGGPGALAGATPESPRINFAEMVQNATHDTVQTVRQAEQVQQAGLVGDVSAQQVVEATLEMETTLKLAVSVRDRLVEAYQQVMQMPI